VVGNDGWLYGLMLVVGYPCGKQDIFSVGFPPLRDIQLLPG